jgi:uncharacterized protein (TIRG00374 family)
MRCRDRGEERVTVEVETVGAGADVARARRRWVKTAAVVVAAAVSLWLLRSSLGAVYGDLADIVSVDPRWLIAILACESIAFVASWQLNRLALRTDGWFDVAVAQLTGNAVSNVIPAGSAAGAAMQLRVLSQAGFEMTRAATSLGALTILGVAGLLAIPALALPSAIALGSNDPGVAGALWVGVALLVACVIGAAVLMTRDAPLARIAGAIQWIRNRFHRGQARYDIPDRVLAERDAIGAAIRQRPFVVVSATIGRTVGDFLALYLALFAAGARPTPMVVLVAFAAANVAGMVPITPGGLGFVEAGMTGALAAVGVDPVQAALAAALYRVVNTWLPSAVGFGALGVFHVRRRLTPAPPAPVAELVSS